MRKTVYLSTATKFIIALIGLLVILSVFPCRMWFDNLSFGTKEVTGEVAPVVNYQNSMLEVFVANESHLQSIDLYLAPGTYPDDYFTVELTDGTGKHLASEKVYPNEVPGYVNVLMDVDTAKGELYILKFTAMRSVYFALEDFTPESEVFVAPSYNDGPLSNKCIVMDFNYRIPYSLAKSILTIGIVVLIATILIALTDMIFGKHNKLITVEDTMKSVLNPVSVIVLLACIIFIVTGKVSPYLPDKIFAALSVVTLGILVFYGINHKRDGQEPILTVDYLRTHISDIVQSLGVAYALQACCEYVSGLYDINHRVAERKEMIGFAVIIIAMFSFKDIVNWYNLLYCIAAAVIGVVYYNRNYVETFTSDDKFVLISNVIVAALFGLILIRTVKALIKNGIKGANLPIGIITLIYFACIIIFRNTRWWTVVLAIAFTLLYLNYGLWSKKKDFIINVIRGVVIQFILCTAWVLMYRPYPTNNGARFSHFFHTETVTATYMTVMICICVVMILTKVNTITKEASIKDIMRSCYKEFILWGIASSYLIFTMSRTAFAAAVVAIVFGLILYYIKQGRASLGVVLRLIVIALLSVILVFPVTFEAQRTLPCLLSKPVTYDIEEYAEDVMRGSNLSSPSYMLVGKFGNLFCEKVLGIESEVFPSYYNVADSYDEYSATRAQIYRAVDGYDFKDYTISDSEWDEEPTNEEFEAYINRFDNQMDVTEPETNTESEDAEITSDNGIEIVEDYTNGRIDIYKSYISQLNMTGHDTMGATLKDGEIATHAHDVYLQVAYDHGIPVTIVFMIFGISALILAIIIYFKDNGKYSLVTVLIIVAFAVAGIVEWVFHLSHPMAFTMLLVLAPLFFTKELKGEKGI